MSSPSGITEQRQFRDCIGGHSRAVATAHVSLHILSVPPIPSSLYRFRIITCTSLLSPINPSFFVRMYIHTVGTCYSQTLLVSTWVSEYSWIVSTWVSEYSWIVSTWVSEYSWIVSTWVSEYSWIVLIARSVPTS